MPGSPRTDPAELLRSLIEDRTHHAVIALDADGVIVSWNAGAQRLTGYKADEVIGGGVGRLYPQARTPADEPEHIMAIASAAGSHLVSGWRVRRNGSRFWADEETTALRGGDGRLLGFGKTIVDMTEGKRGADATLDNEERFRLLIHGVRDQAMITLTATGFVASWNAGAECLTGYRPDDMLGQHFSRFYRADDLLTGAPEEQLEDADASGRLDIEGWRVRRDGSEFWAMTTLTPLRSPDGTMRGYGLIMQDLTNRKRAEDALRAVLRRERETAQRLRDLDAMRDDFEALVTRDLRAPLQMVDSVAGTLVTKWGDLDEPHIRELLERLAVSATGLTHLVDDVLRRARLESGELAVDPGPLDIGALLRSAADRAPDSSDAQVRVDVPADLPPAYCDEQRTWQVLLNLLANARRFSPAGGTILVGARAADPCIRVSVRDQGPGIAPEAQGRIFERFTRLHADDGTGLGLFIARTMVEAQGGQIGVDSVAGAGAEFWFTLPRHGGPEAMDLG